MASTAIVFLFLSALSMATAQQRYFNLSQGSSLSPAGNSSLLSQSGLFAFGFLPFGNGFAVCIWYEGIPQKTVVWTANRNDPPVSRNATIVFTSDGRLILQELGGQEKSITGAADPAFIASILDSGNLVLYNLNSRIIWQSFDYPTDSLLPGQALRANRELVSSISETNHSKGSFRILMQNDGNLVMYPVDSPQNGDYSYWTTHTNFGFAGDNAKLMLDGSGRLYMLKKTGVLFTNLTNSGVPSDGRIYRAAIDADGIFRLYSLQLAGNSNWSIEWSEPKDKCSPIGLCGINAYCDLVNQQPLCFCPPGFVSINQKQTTSGCDRNFVAQSCSFENEHDIEYTIQELQNTTWAESTYAILSPLTREECNQPCLEDCSCEAALLKGQECKKQRLPLTLGKRQQEDGKQITTVFLKIGMGSGQNGTPAPNESSRKGLQMDLLVISVACLAFALSILAFVAFLILRYRLWAYKKVPYNEVSEGLIDDVSLRAFTYIELEVATNGFLEQLGKGSFGTVFKGTLSHFL